MHSSRGAAVAACLLLASFAAAEPIALQGVPAGYSPGEPIAFRVELPPITDLGAYGIDLVLGSDSGEAGTDYWFELGQTGPPGSGYVFPSDVNYFHALTTEANALRLTLTDFDFTGVEVTGLNRIVAAVVANTAPDFSGRLELSIDSSTLILDTPDATPTPVNEYSQIVADNRALDPIELTVIPEPTAALLAAWIIVARGRPRAHAPAGPMFT